MHFPHFHEQRLNENLFYAVRNTPTYIHCVLFFQHRGLCLHTNSLLAYPDTKSSFLAKIPRTVPAIVNPQGFKKGPFRVQ